MKTEAKIQQEIVIWFNNKYCLKHHTPKCNIFSVPNETKNFLELKSKIATGLKKGVADLIILFPNVCLFVEVKTEVGKQSKAQVSFQEDVTKLGFEYILTRSKADLEKQLYGKGYI